MYIEDAVFQLTPGEEVPFTFGTFSLEDRVVTPRTLRVNLVSTQPCLVGLKIYQGDVVVAATRVRACGTAPIRISLRVPRGYDPLPPGTTQLYKVGSVFSVKTTTGTDSAIIKGTLSFAVSLSEVFSSTTKLLESVEMPQ